VISPNTIGFHYGKHHKGYVDNLNKLVAGTELADMPLAKVVTATAGNADRTAVFKQCGAGVESRLLLVESEAWRWRGAPAELARRMEAAFGSVAACKEELKKAALGQFGSGWAGSRWTGRSSWSPRPAMPTTR